MRIRYVSQDIGNCYRRMSILPLIALIARRLEKYTTVLPRTSKFKIPNIFDVFYEYKNA